MPMLEALGRLCRSPEGYALIDVLAQYAPTWLVQMPWLLSDADLEKLQRSLRGSTRERMLREMAQALEVLTIEQPLMLVLEDLHWSDYATLDLLSVLARRQEPARLLLLGTYRPEEVLEQEHPLSMVVQELLSRNGCQALPLTFLSEAAVAAYLTSTITRDAALVLSWPDTSISAPMAIRSSWSLWWKTSWSQTSRVPRKSGGHHRQSVKREN